MVNYSKRKVQLSTEYYCKIDSSKAGIIPTWFASKRLSKESNHLYMYKRGAEKRIAII